MSDADHAHIFADPRGDPSKLDQKYDDPFNSADYQRFVESMVPHCRCEGDDVPCAGVLAGGICDEHKEDRDELFDGDDDPEPNYDAERPLTPLENWQRNDEHNVR